MIGRRHVFTYVARIASLNTLIFITEVIYTGSTRHDVILAIKITQGVSTQLVKIRQTSFKIACFVRYIFRHFNKKEYGICIHTPK